MVSIPAEIARRLELHDGDDVRVREDAGMVIVEPARSLCELLGSWAPLGPPGVMSDAVAMIREDRQGRFEHHESVGWADVTSRPPLFTGSRSEIDEAIRASDRDWASDGPG
jgi:AbrB family looped-hinge helix DNA binding protein